MVVKEAYINKGSGVIDFIPTLDIVQPDIFVVNSEDGIPAKRQLCEEGGIQHLNMGHIPYEGFQAHSSNSIKTVLNENQPLSPIVNRQRQKSAIPTHLDLASIILDGPKIWPIKLPMMNFEMLARLVFCFENNSERDTFVSQGFKIPSDPCPMPLPLPSLL